MENLFDDVVVKDVEESKVVKKETKKSKEKANKEVKSKDNGENKKYKYPFRVYLAAQYPDVDHIFDAETEYSEKEITDKMLSHGFYEFAGNVTYDFRNAENVLIPIFQQHKKG